METKSLFKSKTFWVNLLGGIVTGAGLVSGIIPENKAPYVVAAGGIANILLRLVTSQGVTVTGGQS
jgi:hypothetical protein